MQCVVERARPKWNGADLVISFPSSVRPDGPRSGLPWACTRRSASDPLSQTSPMPVAERRTWTGAGAEPAPPPRADDTPARTRRGRARVDRRGGSGRPVHQGGARASRPIRSIGHWQCGHSGGGRGIGAGAGRGRTRSRRSTWRHRFVAAGASQPKERTRWKPRGRRCCRKRCRNVSAGKRVLTQRPLSRSQAGVKP
jgi:hypothetical protein